MLYDDTDGRTLLARERAELPSSEMRRVRSLTPEQAGHPSWTRLTAGRLGRAERMRRRKSNGSPAYDA
jgi:hypothetical protein